MPECSVNLSEAVVYMALAPKSNAMEVGYNAAKEDALTMLDEPVPLVIRNAPTKLMDDLGYGKGYQYAHDNPDRLTNMVCLPDSLKDKVYYVPTEQGLESKYKARLLQIKAWKKEHSK
jgi:putative ATPase